MAKKKNPTIYTINIGLRIKQSRKKMKLNGVDFAKIIESSSSQLSDWENGHSIFGADQLFFLSKKLGVSPAWLLTGEGEMEKKENPQ